MPVIVARMEQTPPDLPQTSGFYGPGAWAAWVITMAASWISIIQGDYTHNLHFFGYMLYTNWAAIDFMRQGPPVSRDDNHSLAEEQARLQNIVASIAVLNVGAFQAVAQLLVCVRTERHPRAIQVACTKVGVFILFCVMFFSSLFVAVSSQFKVLNIFTITLVLFPGCVLNISFCSASENPHYRWDDTRILVFLTLLFNLLVTFNLFMNDAITVLYENVDSRDTVPTWRCYFVPCASQGIREWDQAFSLLVALFLFFYEFGPGMVRIVGLGTEDNVCTPILQTMGSIWGSLVHPVQTASQSVETGSSLRAEPQNETWGSGGADEQV